MRITKMERVNILGTWIDNLTMSEALLRICKLVDDGKFSYVVTPNVDHLIKLRKDSDFRQIYNKATIVLPDGMPILWTSIIMGTPLKERVNGTDLFLKLCEVSSEKGYKLFFLGGKPGSALKAAKVLRGKYQKINVIGEYSPPFGFENNKPENDKIVKMIKNGKPDILFVGLGAPKQEKWVFRHFKELNVPVSIGIGASFEFASGVVKRAPVWMQKSGLEWFWRLMMEPKRLWRRYLVDDMKFLGLVAKAWLKERSRS